MLLIGLIVGLGLLTWELGAKSFWCDELFTVRMIDYSPEKIVAEVAKDLHPPLYFLLMRGWSEVMGTGERALRLPSVLFALSGLWFTWQLGMKTVGRKATHAGLIALACSPLFIEFSRMARYYSLTLALGVLATLMFVNAVRGNRLLDWAGYSIASTLLLYTFYLGGTLILAHGLFLVLNREATRKQRAGWLVSTFIIALAFAGWLPVVMSGQVGRASWHRADFAASLSGLALSLSYPWFAFSVGETIFPWFPTAILAAGAMLWLIVWWFFRNRSPWRWLMLILIFLPILFISLTVVFIATATPFLNIPVRTLFVLPYFALALGAGWGALPRLSWRIGLAALIGITWTFSLFNYYTNQNFLNPIYSTPTRQVAQEIAAEAGVRNIVIGEEGSGFSYYYRQTGKGTPYFEALQTDVIVAYVTTHPVDKVWLVTIGRDGTLSITPTKTMRWLEKNYSLTLKRGYTELDPVYRKVKALLLRRPTYRYRLLVQRYERIP